MAMEHTRVTTFPCGGRQYAIRHADGDGAPLAAGETVTNGRGDEITIHGVTRGPEYNGTAKVDVTVVKSARFPNHDGFRHAFYDHALLLVVTAVD